MKEQDIRPKEIFDRYRELAEKDIKVFFSNSVYKKRRCPACGKEGIPEFNKKGFDYCLCPNCKTLYVNPLPKNESFVKYYTQSASTKFWATDFYKLTEDARRVNIFIPRVKLIDETIQKNNPEIKSIVEIGAGYGTFAEELKKIGKYSVCAIEPNKDLQDVLRTKGLNVVPRFLEDCSKKDFNEDSNCFVSFELIEHLVDPKTFFEKVFGLMKRGDLFFFTTLNGQGLDIQVLWEKSKSIQPPYHINFFNPFSIKLLLEKVGFKVLEVRTPGKLDVDILNNNKEDIKDGFWKVFIEKSSPDLKQKMQETISETGFSSHMLVIAQKK